jgi:hypothetical protein
MQLLPPTICRKNTFSSRSAFDFFIFLDFFVSMIPENISPEAIKIHLLYIISNKHVQSIPFENGK